MFTRRRSIGITAGILLAMLALGAFLRHASAGKPPAPPPTAPPYSITFLGTLGGRDTFPSAINSGGDIVGYSITATGSGAAFLSTIENGSRVLYNLNDKLSPADQAQWYLQDAGDINDAGQIVGNGKLNGIACGYRYKPAYTDASGVLHPAVVEKVGNLGGAEVIDPSGNNVVGKLPGSPERFLATYDPNSGSWTTLDIGGFATVAYRINRLGEICGETEFPPSYDNHAFRWDPVVGMKDLGFFQANRGGITHSGGADMDESGQVVGQSTAGGRNYRAFRYTDAQGLVDLGTLGGSSSGASGIDRSGTMIVGSSATASGSNHLFLYTTTKGMMDLEAAIANLPAEYSGSLGVRRINDRGWVCGTAYPVLNGPHIAFLLTPK